MTNSSNNYTFTTQNGTIYIDNGTIPKFNITYTFNLTSNDSGGYFSSFFTVNITNGNTSQLSIAQSWVYLNVTNILTGQGMSSFTATINLTSTTGTDGIALFPAKAGAFALNVSSTQFPKKISSFTIAAMQNLSISLNLSPSFNFFLRREADNSPFDVLGTNTTKLTIFCPDKSITINFKNSTFNHTEANATIDCPYTLMKMDVTYADSSYFRALIPEYRDINVTWFLLDLNNDIGVQIILNLVDLTGEWSNGILRLTKPIGNKIEKIIEQRFDVSVSTTNYLLKDGIYTVILVNNDGSEERQLGSLTADTASTKTITYPNIPFYPDNKLGENISWSYTFNTTAQILRLVYKDGTAGNTLLQWKVYNETNGTRILLQTFQSTATTGATFTYTPAIDNVTYYTELFAQSTAVSFNITDSKVFGNFEAWIGGGDGFEPEQWSNIKHYFSLIFIVVWGMMFSARHVGIGLTSTFFWMLILRWAGWFVISGVTLTIAGFIVLLSWLAEAMRKQ